VPSKLLLADLDRAIELVREADESKLDFAPDATVSADVKALTGIVTYPVNSHRENVQARFDAVVKAGDKLDSREASEYVSKLISECGKLSPLGCCRPAKH